MKFRNLVVGLLASLACIPACKTDEGAAPGAASEATAPLSVKRGLLVARGLGSLADMQLTNSVEALRCNHQRGFRWFEVDVEATADGELVCFRKGNEKVAGLEKSVSGLRISEVEARKYADRFPIPRFSTLLSEADHLGDVVLLVDIAEWSQRMEEAFSRTLGYGPAHTTRVVLQAYNEKDLARIAPLSKELGAGLILNVRKRHADDAKVEALVKQYAPLAVIAASERFTPWLAERLHSAQLPLLVHGVNDHRDIVRMSRAGADGFVTDRYVPYERIAADPAAAMECGQSAPTQAQLLPWKQRSILRKGDYRLNACAARKPSSVELASCDGRPAIRSNALAVPAGQPLRVELEAEAGDAGGNVWLELVQTKPKRRRVRQREVISLQPKERRALRYDVDLPNGSLGIEARLGTASKRDRVILHRLRVYHGEPEPDALPAKPLPAPDAGD